MNAWKKVNEASPETSAWLQQMLFAIFSAPKTDENLANLFYLSSGKKVKSSPCSHLAVAMLR